MKNSVNHLTIQSLLLQGDGGFCALRGSHKLNFATYPDLINGDAPEFEEHIFQV